MLKIDEIWGGITKIFKEICRNLAQILRRTEEISHTYVLVDLTFTDVMSSNITVYSRRNTIYPLLHLSNLSPLFYDSVLASRHRKRYHFSAFFWKQKLNFSLNCTTLNKKKWDINTFVEINYPFVRLLTTFLITWYFPTKIYWQKISS